MANNYSVIVPAVTDLVARWDAAAPGLKVVCGPQVGDAGRKDVLEVFCEVGSPGDPATAYDAAANLAGSSEIVWAGQGNLARDEVATINSSLTCWLGSGDMLAALARADEYLQQLQQSLYEDAEIGQELAYGLLRNPKWHNGQSPSGAFVECRFSVDVKARLSV